MTTFQARIEITHRPGILDPQGANIERALPALGYDNVGHVSVGKSIRLVLDEMCHRLLANPVIEDFTIELTAIEGATA
jgi:phosphoribosylformylglycinamidine synthase subunit PurS